MARPKNVNTKSLTRNPNGMGNIYKRENGRYEWTQMVDGQKRHASDMDLTELRKKIKKLSKVSVDGDKTKLFDWMERWLENYVKPYKKPSTYDNYRIAYEKYIKKYMRNVQLRHVTKQDVQKMITDLINDKYSVSLIKNVRKALSAAYISASEDEQLVDFNPTRDTKLPKAPTPKRKTFNLEELAIIIDKFSNSRWLYGIMFMLATGLRRGELLGLKWSNIDFKESRILVENNYTMYGEGTPKDNDYHAVPLTEHAKAYLIGWENQLRSENNPATVNKSDIIFVSKKGTHLSPSTFNSMFDKRKFSFKVTPHMFRHTFVYLSKGKITLSELQEALGHSQSTTTLDIYGIMLANTTSVADKIESAYLEMDKLINKSNKSDDKVVDFTQRRLAKS